MGTRFPSALWLLDKLGSRSCEIKLLHTNCVPRSLAGQDAIFPTYTPPKNSLELISPQGGESLRVFFDKL
jgi:hypothetical protein